MGGNDMLNDKLRKRKVEYPERLDMVNPVKNFDSQGFYERVTFCRNKLGITSFVEFGGRKMYNMFKRKTAPNLNIILSVYNNSKDRGLDIDLDWLILGKGSMQYNDSNALADKEALTFLKELNSAQKKIIELNEELNKLKLSHIQ